jgi:DNA-binding CsgD family transcriptional regulator
MAAYSLPISTELPSAGSPFSYRSTLSPIPSQISPVGSAIAARRSAGKPASQPRIEKSSQALPAELTDLKLLWSSLVDSLQQGVIVVSRRVKPIYWNQKAKELCRHLTERQELTLSELPTAVSEACHRLLRSNRLSNEPLVMECQVSASQTIRIQMQWLTPNSSREFGSGSDRTSSSYIVVFLEDCTERLRAELRIEQKKYDLTEREAEVWMLLRQEYTYQEIAKMLQISLNTVKTHVKNVYAKKRSCQGREKIWCSE